MPRSIYNLESSRALNTENTVIMSAIGMAMAWIYCISTNNDNNDISNEDVEDLALRASVVPVGKFQFQSWDWFSRGNFALSTERQFLNLIDSHR